MTQLKKKVNITLDPDVIVKVKELCEADERSFSQYINLVLKAHITADSARTGNDMTILSVKSCIFIRILDFDDEPCYAIS